MGADNGLFVVQSTQLVGRQNRKNRAPAQNYFFVYYFVFPDGLVAQLVEQRIENPRVGGSIPPQATKEFKHLAHLFRWAFCFSGALAHDSCN